MLINPELKRYIWQDFSAHKLIIAPLVIGLIAYIEYLFNPSSLIDTPLYLAYFFILLWGTRNASDAVIQEVNNSTWDFQRQSTLSPWALTWGKLLGSSLYSWYCAGLCFFILALQKDSAYFIQMGSLLIGGLLGQSIALLSSLPSIRNIHREKNLKSFKYFILGAVCGYLTTALIIWDSTDQTTLAWHGLNIATNTFHLISMLIFLGWSILGLYRAISQELQYKAFPWIWLVFNGYFIIYFSGFDYHFAQSGFDFLNKFRFNLSFMPFYLAFTAAIFLNYVALLFDDLSPIRYRKFFTRIGEKNLSESLQQLPWWTLSFACCVITALLAAIQPDPISPLPENFSLLAFIFNTVLFMLRDTLLFHYFSFTRKQSHVLGNVLLYLFILYVLLPVLGNLLHIKWHYLFLPGVSYPYATTLSALAQCGFLIWLCWQKWQKIWQGLYITHTNSAH